MSDQLKAVLDSTPTSDRVRATAWDLYYSAPDAEQLGRVLERINLPPDARIRMTELKARASAQQSGPGAGQRFATNAAEVLNPIAAVRGVYNAVRHPIDTGKNIVDAQVGQFTKARDAFSGGRYSEAVGHGLATAVPLLGPVAADAGEQIASGDVAGGLGKATGLLLPVGATPIVKGAAKTARIVPAGVRAGAADALESGAAARVADVMSPAVGPNKTRFGNMAEGVAPKVAQDMAKNGAPLSRDGLHAQVGERLALAEQTIDAAHDARLGARTLETQPLIDALLQKRQALTAEAVDATSLSTHGPLGQNVVPGPNAARVAVIDQAIDELRRLGPVTRYDPIRVIRQSYDGPAKATYNPSMTADFLKAQGGKFGASDVTSVLREQLGKWDPGTAAANADYHVYRTANDVLEATREIERTRPRVGRAIMARLTATMAGQQAAGTAGAIGGYVLGPVVESALAGGATTKLMTANVMSKLAGAIRRGDVQSVQGLTTQLTRVRRGSAVQHANERATNPSESRAGLAPAPQ